jgi:double-strand break repair protein MRE11
MTVPSSDPDNVRALISTDNHLGYLEKDPLRGDDSFRAFEEVLALAKSNRVDMVLLGGDLFHENKPSRRTLVRTMNILRKHCLGDEPVALAVRSDPAAVNYMDRSYSVSLPIFVIHGNHDDCTGAAGAEALSALDILAQANLITYFGKAPDSRRINILPILLQKGCTKIALYGLGNIRDDVLYETWMNSKQVHWMSPKKEDDEDTSVDWFSIFLIHQNRAVRGSTKAIAETCLPQWLDYVVWGHEHDSHPTLTKTAPPVVQPGSTVATSLALGESLPKHVVMLEVKRGRMKHREIALQTVRLFEFGEVHLGDPKHDLSVADHKGTEKFLYGRLQEMIKRQETAFDEKRSLWESGIGPPAIAGVKYPPAEYYLAHLPRVLRQPLIRLRVEYSGGFDTINPQRFGQSFVGRVASATEILLFFKKRKAGNTKPFMYGHVGSRSRSEVPNSSDYGQNGEAYQEGAGDGNGTLEIGQAGGDGNEMEIPTLVEYFLYHKEAGGTGLKFLELDKLSDAVDEFVVKAEPRAIPDYVISYMKLQQNSTLTKQEKRGSVFTEKEILEGFEGAAKRAAGRLFDDKMKEEREETRRKRDENNWPAEEGGDAAAGAAKDKDDDASEEDDKEETVVPDELPLARFDRVHAVLSANPKTAAVARAARADVDKALPSDDSDDDFIDDAALPASRKPRAIARAATRGGRGRGRPPKAASAGTTRKTPSAAPASRAKRAAPAARPRSTARRAAAVTPSYNIASDDDDDDDDDDDAGVVIATDEIEESDVEDEVVPKSRKRKAPAPSAAPSSDRARSKSRKTGRGSSRPVTNTIPLDDSDE